jgi:8-oxo-dGTP pyrophosphatase MutT (NUDIX family)
MIRPDSAFAVIRRNRHVLVVLPKGKRRWKLPGGKLKSRETAVQAARREVREETGLSLRISGLSGIYRRSDGSMAYVFLARTRASARLKGPRNEIERQCWVDAGEARHLLPKAARRRLRDALRRPRPHPVPGISARGA